MTLKDNIVSLRRIAYISKYLKHKKIPQVDSSIHIITEEIIKHTFAHSQLTRFSLPCKIVMDVQHTLNRQPKLQKKDLTTIPFSLYYLFGILERQGSNYLLPFLFHDFKQNILQKWPIGSKLTMVDFCCGTGVIGLSILKQLQKQYQITATFIDINPKAIKYTKINAEMNQIPLENIELIVGDIINYLQLTKSANLILSNPPYISINKYNRLQKQVKLYEDPKALVSGIQGMDLIEPLIKAIQCEKQIRDNFIAGVEYDGQSVAHHNLEHSVYKDQYGRRRYLIVV